MYKNIGGKLKGLAIGLFIAMAVAAFIGGIVMLINAIDYSAEDLIPVALLMMLVGPVVSWIFSWILYGFGELVDKTVAIERNTKSAGKSEAQVKLDAEKISQIEHLRDQGLITESEYRQVMARFR